MIPEIEANARSLFISEQKCKWAQKGVFSISAAI